MEFTQLGVSAGAQHYILSHKPEILELVKAYSHFIIREYRRASFDRIKRFGSVEAEDGNVAEITGPDAVLFLAECMRRIIDHLQPMPVGDLPDPLHITDLSVDMDRQDRARLFRDQVFDLLRIYRIIIPLYITEHGSQPIPHDRMGRGRKGKRSRDDLALQSESLNRRLQRKMPVRECHTVRDLQEILQPLLKLFVKRSHICDLVCLPYSVQHPGIFFPRREIGLCYINVFHVLLLCQ